MHKGPKGPNKASMRGQRQVVVVPKAMGTTGPKKEVPVGPRLVLSDSQLPNQG